MDEMSAVKDVLLSDSTHTGAVAYALAKVNVTEVRSVPVMVMVPLVSFPTTLDVPPDTVGVVPPVMMWPFESI